MSGKLRLSGSTSGYIELQPEAAANSSTLTIPNEGFGRILQIVQHYRTDVGSEDVAAGTKSGAGMTKTITTTANDRKVLVSFDVCVSAAGPANRIGVTIKRGGTEIALSDDTSDNKLRDTVGVKQGDVNAMYICSFQYLDTPGNAADYTYTLHFNTGSSSTREVFLNRASTESNHNYRFRATSHLTLAEVVG